MVMTIGHAAQRLGIPTHVLRHWDDVGVLTPSARTAAGHRRYRQNDVERALIIQRCQRAGLSLADITALASAAPGDRPELVDRSLATLRQQRLELDAAIGFLTHTLHCSHPIIDDCPECATFAHGPHGRRTLP